MKVSQQCNHTKSCYTQCVLPTAFVSDYTNMIIIYYEQEVMYDLDTNYSEASTMSQSYSFL